MAWTDRHRLDIWDIIKDNAVLLITVVSGIVVAVGYPLGWLPQPVALSTIVGILTLFTTSEILERRRRFARLESMLENGFESTIQSLQGVEVRFFETETEFFKDMTGRIRKVRHLVKYASLGPSREKVSPAVEEFYSERAKALAAGEIRFNYLTVFNNRVHLERV